MGRGPLGQVEGGEVRLSRLGEVAQACWWAIPEHFDEVELAAFVVMPNHVHGGDCAWRWEGDTRVPLRGVRGPWKGEAWLAWNGRGCWGG